MLGYQSPSRARDGCINCLRWTPAIDPVTWQPAPTVYERAPRRPAIPAATSVRASSRRSGLTRAVYRGVRATSPPTRSTSGSRRSAASGRAPRPFVTVYHGDLDATGT